MEAITTQIIRPYKDHMTYSEAVEYIGKSESYFKSKIREYCVPSSPTGFYSKAELDRIKLGVMPEKQTA